MLTHRSQVQSKAAERVGWLCVSHPHASARGRLRPRHEEVVGQIARGPMPDRCGCAGVRGEHHRPRAHSRCYVCFSPLACLNSKKGSRVSETHVLTANGNWPSTQSPRIRTARPAAPSAPMGVRGAGGPPKNTRGRPRARCRRGPTGIELKGSAGIETVTADACAKLYTIGLMLPPKPAPVAGKCRRRRCDAPLRCRPNDHQGTTPSTERGCRLSSRGHATRAGPSASAPWSCRARSLTAAASVKSQWQCCCSGPRCGPRST